MALGDVAAQPATAWVREKLYQLVNYRVHPGAPPPAHREDVQGMEREFTQVHGRSASRLKAAVHIHISAL